MANKRSSGAGVVFFFTDSRPFFKLIFSFFLPKTVPFALSLSRDFCGRDGCDRRAQLGRSLL